MFARPPESDQEKALGHILLVENSANAPERVALAQPVDIRQAVVLGGGNIGASIACALVGAHIRTTIVETDAEAAERALSYVARLADDAEQSGQMTTDEARDCKARITAVTDCGSLPRAEIAIESGFEALGVTKQIFAALDDALPQSAVLASNTTFLDINEIATAVSDPARVIGLHFSSPAHIMKLIEVIRGEASSDSALATGFALARSVRKFPVLSGVCDGFIGNRILARYREAADTVLMDGSAPWDVDEAMIEFGYRMGPYEAQDLSGLDIAYADRKRQAPTRDPNRRYIPISDRMVEEGRLGRKTSVGWYRYPGGGGAVIDPLLEDLIREEAYFAKVPRRDFTHDEIRARLLCAMINEAADILAEGIARSANDIDLVTVHGHGFPRWRGGLMYYADRVGLDVILGRILEFAREDAVAWKASPLLVDLVRSGRGFGGL